MIRKQEATQKTRPDFLWMDAAQEAFITRTPRHVFGFTLEFTQRARLDRRFYKKMPAFTEKALMDDFTPASSKP